MYLVYIEFACEEQRSYAPFFRESLTEQKRMQS